MSNKQTLEDGSSDVCGLTDRGVARVTSQINDNYLVDHTGEQNSAYRFVVVLVK